jgi:aldehyde:ferredoxin oxidoreductase
MKQETCYAGKLLRVDLTTGTIGTERLNPLWARDFVGGKGLGFRYLLDVLPPHSDPLSPANAIVIFTGALAGTCVATTARTVICTRSPATGTILDSYVGGAFALQLKLAGYDGIIITGKAPNPTALLIRDERVELRDATAMWGRGIWETDAWMKEQGSDHDLVTLAIGPAGENLVPFACLTSEAYRQAGRGGAGAVFGSKNLKAVGVRGTGAVRVPDMPSFLKLYEEVLRTNLLTDANLWANSAGTPMIVGLSQGAGLLPTRGFSQGVFSEAEKINAEAIQSRKQANRACATCPLACGQLTRTASGLMEGPEYETLGMGGANCAIGDLDAVAAFNRLCDNLGLDTISTGNILGLAMLMAEEGIHDFGIHFGNVEEFLEATEAIAYRRGVGEVLSKGARYIAQTYGAEHLVMENKGLEFPAYDPRGSFGMALAYCTSDRGGCHLRAWTVANDAFAGADPFTLEGRAEMTMALQNFNSVKWTGIFCDFWAIDAVTLTRLLAAGTGQPYTEADIYQIGERIWNLGRLFNVREGFRRKDDFPPPAIFDRPLPEGPAAGKNFTREDYDAALSEYYRLRGWDEDGVPTPEKLAELGLEDLMP